MSKTRLAEIMTRLEFQALYRISDSKFFLMQANGKLPPFYKVGGTLLIPRSEAADWFRKLKVKGLDGS